ncbi:MAG: hypothetical protein GWM90_07910 [Gemmatimonadetes bacterium]|nr:hypothetical protein [Gemmatimonadota bacterium]NIR36088.1 hypothetical protein [Actinomycetota bacterium]NIU73966.1 hypothetical protein [Gammaproteobacteria bacterium]NIQ53795.1 hypothetical protein [Gemmatimonadota bacterium]NIX44037.1 hypothetical protein [Gemmatimonadota bacterium]
MVEYHGIIRDVTEQRRARARLARTARALRRSNAELEQFAYVASHDLQEPLRKIRAFGDRLSTVLAGELDDGASDDLRRMIDGARRMQALIDTLLLYSRVSSGPVARRPVDLGATVAEVVEDLEPTITGAGAQLDIGPLPIIEADPIRMRQLFQNLIANAVKYARDRTPPRIRLHAESLDERHRPVPAEHPEAVLARIRVEDNGIGFEPEDAERIFELFQRLHRRDEFEGTGIGLAVCRRIVARHHGTLSARGTPGGGATFTVVLPRTQERHDDH